MTQVGSAVLDGEEIVIRVQVGAVIEMAESRFAMQVTDREGFTKELMEDLQENPVELLAEVAGSLVDGFGSNAVTSSLLTQADDDESVDETPRPVGPGR